MKKTSLIPAVLSAVLSLAIVPGTAWADGMSIAPFTGVTVSNTVQAAFLGTGIFYHPIPWLGLGGKAFGGGSNAGWVFAIDPIVVEADKAFGRFSIGVGALGGICGQGGALTEIIGFCGGGSFRTGWVSDDRKVRVLFNLEAVFSPQGPAIVGSNDEQVPWIARGTIVVPITLGENSSASETSQGNE